MTSGKLKYVIDKKCFFESLNHVNPLLRNYWSVNSSSTDKPTEEWVRNFDEVQEYNNADFFMLPMYWQYYQKNNLLNTVSQSIKEAKEWGIPIIIFSDGDFPAIIPHSGCIIFEKAGYKSRRQENNNLHFSYPVFVSDYLKNYTRGELRLRRKETKAIIGFCGQAGGNLFDFSKREIVRIIRFLRFKSGLSYKQPPPFETTRFRKSTINRLSKSNLVYTNFLIRTRYRAGYWAPKKDPFHPTRLEFVRNILDTDYTVCMRGGGNFSVRFYETLSLGRIPVFVDTDCILPLDHIYDYRNDFIWVDQDQLSQIDEIIADFHANLSAQDFIDLQIKCRKLWEKNFTKEGFLGQFASHLNVCNTKTVNPTIIK